MVSGAAEIVRPAVRAWLASWVAIFKVKALMVPSFFCYWESGGGLFDQMLDQTNRTQ